jgi:hypothetical protein
MSLCLTKFWKKRKSAKEKKSKRERKKELERKGLGNSVDTDDNSGIGIYELSERDDRLTLNWRLQLNRRRATLNRTLGLIPQARMVRSASRRISAIDPHGLLFITTPHKAPRSRVDLVAVAVTSHMRWILFGRAPDHRTSFKLSTVMLCATKGVVTIGVRNTQSVTSGYSTFRRVFQKPCVIVTTTTNTVNGIVFTSTNLASGGRWHMRLGDITTPTGSVIDIVTCMYSTQLFENAIFGDGVGTTRVTNSVRH